MATRKTTAAKTPAETKPEAKPAEGYRSVTRNTWGMKPRKVNPSTVPELQQNVHYQDAVANIMRQIYPAPPEVWVTDADGETDQKLTDEAVAEFERLGCWDLMQFVARDIYGWGCFVYSPGIVQAGGLWKIEELRHLPPESFGWLPPVTTSHSIPNDLMPGITIDGDGNLDVWQVNYATGQQMRLDNVRTVREHGTPAPSGIAHMRPAYNLLSLIDYGMQAEVQQVNRIGAPALLLKAVDEIDDEDYASLQDWSQTFLRSWGKDTAALLPPGVELPTLNIREGTTAREFVNQLVDWIRVYANPMSDMSSTGALGTSDAGRMEIWANFVASEQTLAEHWLEELFDWLLHANGWEGYHTHIRLRRPSIDKTAIRLQYLQVLAGDMTREERRDNATDVLELHEWSDELNLQIEQDNPQTSPALAGLFGNTESIGDPENFSAKEDKIMQRNLTAVEKINQQAQDAILRLLNLSGDKQE